MKYAIIENDNLSLRRIKNACDKLRPEWELQFTAASVEESLVYLDRYRDLDLILCDIELDDGLSFQIFKSHKLDCPIIFLTAFEQYALDAFKLFSIDYLLKPLEIAELENAFLKYERIGERGKSMSDDVLDRLESALTVKSHLKRLLISVSDRFESISIEDINIFINEDKYVYAILKNGQNKLTTFKSLNDLEEMLDPDRYFRISRDTIATITSIRKVTRWFKGKLKVQLESGDYEREVLVSSGRRNDFLQWFGT